MRVASTSSSVSTSQVATPTPVVKPEPPPAPKPKAPRDALVKPVAEKAAPKRATAPRATPTDYRVRPGDTMSGIAAKNDLSLKQLIKLNPQVKNPSLIHVGEVIHLAKKRAPPKTTTYTVKSGDTFGEIAKAHGLTTPQLSKLNPQVKDINLIHPGEKLRVKAKAPQQPSTPSTPTTPSTPSTPSQPQPSGPQAAERAGMPNTVGWSQAKEFALYSDFVNKFGDAQAKKDLAAGKRVVLSLRNDTPMTSDKYYGAYDDRMVVLWKDKSGPHVVELAANTEPNRRWSIEANNSSKPVGRIATGQTVRYYKTWSSKFGNHLQPYGNPYAQRDENRNYRFDKNEKKYNGSWGGQLMYIHRAYDGNTGSQGCQTLDPSHFDSFWRALGSQRDFSNVLVDVTKG